MSSWYLRSTPSVAFDGLGVQRDLVEREEGAGPVEGLGDSGQLEQVGGAQPLDEADDLLGEGCGQLGGAQAQDLQLAGRVRIVDPVVEAAPLERVVDLARAVRGEDDDRRRRRAHGAHLRDR